MKDSSADNRASGEAGARRKRPRVALAVASAVAVGGATLAVFSLSQAASTAAPSLNAGDKVTICHRTDANNNPYVVITPDAAGVFNGHLGHTGPVWDPTLKAQHTKWGDIIPPFTYQGATYSQNWGADGQAIFNNGCKTVAGPTSPPASGPVS